MTPLIPAVLLLAFVVYQCWQVGRDSRKEREA